MKFGTFIKFDGNCREAVEFYARAFKSEVKHLNTYGQMPPDSNWPASQTDKNRIMYASIHVGNISLMFMDMPAGKKPVKGNNVTPAISLDDATELKRLFNELKEGGKIEMEPQQTFFSDLYAVVTDKYGICWQMMFKK